MTSGLVLFVLSCDEGGHIAGWPEAMLEGCLFCFLVSPQNRHKGNDVLIL